MRADFINPFVASVTNAFRTMLACEIERGELYLNTNHAPPHEVSGVVGLSGISAGTVVLSFSKDLALAIASQLLQTPCSELNADVTDAIGEMTNIVAGGAKAQLEELHLQLGLPNVIVGNDYSVRFPSNVQPLVVPYHTVHGDFSLVVGFAAEPAAVLA
jgi:chemotaxis protein CheX